MLATSWWDRGGVEQATREALQNRALIGKECFGKRTYLVCALHLTWLTTSCLVRLLHVSIKTLSFWRRCFTTGVWGT